MLRNSVTLFVTGAIAVPASVGIGPLSLPPARLAVSPLAGHLRLTHGVDWLRDTATVSASRPPMIGRDNRRRLAKEPYEDRDETLRLLGFPNYRAYLRSPLWTIVRERALAIHGRKCQNCSRPATQAHHAVYSRAVLSGEDVRGLVPICGPCHKRASLTRKRSKDRLLDRIKVAHLHDTNAILRKRIPSAKRRGARANICKLCGRMRKKNKPFCRPCMKAAQRRAPRLEIQRIDAGAANAMSTDMRPRLSGVKQIWESRS